LVFRYFSLLCADINGDFVLILILYCVILTLILYCTTTYHNVFFSTGDACSLRLICAIKFYLLTYLLTSLVNKHFPQRFRRILVRESVDRPVRSMERASAPIMRRVVRHHCQLLDRRRHCHRRYQNNKSAKFSPVAPTDSQPALLFARSIVSVPTF